MPDDTTQVEESPTDGGSSGETNPGSGGESSGGSLASLAAPPEPATGGGVLGSALASDQPPRTVPNVQNIPASAPQEPLKGLGGRLRGVLYGLATGGAVGGVAGAIAPNIERDIFQRRQQAAKARTDLETAQAQGAQQNLQFESVRAADSHILAMKQAQNYDQLDEQSRAAVRKMNDEHAQFLMDDFGIIPDLTIEGNGQSVHDQASGALNTLAGENGGQIPPVSVNVLPHDGQNSKFTIQVHAPSQQDLVQNQQGFRKLVDTANAVKGLPPMNDTLWATMGWKGQREAALGAMQFLSPNQPFTEQNLPAVLAQRKQQLAAYEKHIDQNGQPDADPAVVSALSRSVDFLSKASDDMSATRAKQAADTKNAEANTPSGQLETKLKTAELAKTQQEIAKGNEELGVAYDPNAENADGTKGANIVVQRGKAREQGLQFYKEDPAQINSTVGGMNDVQNKLNQLAAITTNPKEMTKVQPELAAALLAHGKGIVFSPFGMGVDLSRVNEGLYADDVKKANPATRQYITALLGAHEAITQLPRLQTFGKSNRMTQTQMEAAANLLPQPGDSAGDATFAKQKMESLQTMIDPLRKQIPRMAGAELMPSWRDAEKSGTTETRSYQGHTYAKQPDGTWKLSQ